MKKNIQKYLDNLAYFQMAFKMCRKITSTKTERNDRYSWKQNWAREKHLNKQTVQSLQGLRKLHQTLHGIEKVLKSTQQKHILVLRDAKHQTLASSYDKGS